MYRGRRKESRHDDGGTVFEFPLSGERIIVRTSCRESNGTLAVFEFVQPHRTKPTFAHFHLTRDEEFEIIVGSANYRLNGAAQMARAGDRFTVPLGATHVHPWNTNDEELRFLMTFRASQPDLQGMLTAEQAFATLARLARAGKLKRDLTPKSVLQAVVLLHAAMPSVYVAGLSIPLQRTILGALARVARLRGYQAADPDATAA
jgi:quercetin dioxygenase-like cupin family protein